MSCPIGSQGVQPCYIFGKPPKNGPRRKEDSLLKQVLEKNACQRVTVSMPDSDLVSSPECVAACQRQANNENNAGAALLQTAQKVSRASSPGMCTIL